MTGLSTIYQFHSCTFNRALILTAMADTEAFGLNSLTASSKDTSLDLTGGTG